MTPDHENRPLFGKSPDDRFSQNPQNNQERSNGGHHSVVGTNRTILRFGVLVVVFGLLLGATGMAHANQHVVVHDYVGAVSRIGAQDFVVCESQTGAGIGGVCIDVPPGADRVDLRFNDQVCRNQSLFPFWPDDPRDDLPEQVPETIEEHLAVVPWVEPPIDRCGPGGYVFFKTQGGQTLSPQVHFACVNKLTRDLPPSAAQIVVKFWSPGHAPQAPDCFGTAGEVRAIFT